MRRRDNSPTEGVKPVRPPGRFPLGAPLDMMRDATFDALANEHRRNLLVALLEESPQEAAVRASADVDAGALKTRQRLQTAMYHSHLPKLVDYGFIEWNTDTREIAKGPQFEEIRPVLECIDESTES